MNGHHVVPSGDYNFVVQHFHPVALEEPAGCCFGLKNSGVSIVPVVSSVLARAVETERIARSYAASTIMHSHISKTSPAFHSTYNTILVRHRCLADYFTSDKGEPKHDGSVK